MIMYFCFLRGRQVAVDHMFPGNPKASGIKAHNIGLVDYRNNFVRNTPSRKIIRAQFIY